MTTRKFADRSCEECGARYTPRSGSAKCCSAPCKSARDTRLRKKKDPTAKREQSRAYRLRKLFGLSVEQYDAMLLAQEGRCAICRNRPGRQRLAVDHNHKTGAIRGLLCGRCNHKLLGSAKESSEILRRAADYLESPPASAVLSPPLSVLSDQSGTLGE